MADHADVEELHRRLAEEEARLQYQRFGHDEAWQLGSRIREVARARDLPVAIGVDLGEQAVFRAGLPGSTRDNDRWLARKFATVRYFAKSSLATMAMGQDPGVYATLGLDRAAYAFAGGAFPIRVNGALVGTVGVSGLTDIEDHDLVVEVLEELTGADSG
ncbi:MAG TPA: heme-degrading domain-containing protein [Ilumatobacteraceae bacterium]